MKEDVKTAKHMMEISLNMKKREAMSLLQKETDMTTQLKVALEVAVEKDSKDTIVEMIEKFSETTSEYRNQIEVLQETHHEIAPCEEAHKAKIDELTAELQQLHSVQLETSDAANKTLSSQLQEIQDELDEVQSKMEDACEESTKLKAQSGVLQGQLQRLTTKELSILTMTSEETEAVLCEILDQACASIQVVEQLATKFDVQSAEEVPLRLSAEEDHQREQKAQLQALTEQLEVKEHEEQTLQDQIEAAESARVKELEELHGELDVVKQENATALSELASASVMVETLKEAAPLDVVGFAEAKGKVAELGSKLSTTEARLAEADVELVGSQQELQTTRQTHTEVVNVLEEQLEITKVEMKSVKQAQDEALAELASVKVMVETLKEAALPDVVEFAEVKGKVAELESSMTAATLRLAEVGEELETSEQALRTAKQAHGELVSALEEQVEGTKSEAKIAKQAHAEEHDALQGELLTLRSEVQILTVKLEDKAVPKIRGPPGGALDREVQALLEGIGDSQAGVQAILAALQAGIKSESFSCESAALQMVTQALQSIATLNGEKLSQIEVILAEVAKKLVECGSSHYVAAANVSMRLQKAVTLHRHKWKSVVTATVRQAVNAAAEALLSMTECLEDQKIAAELQQLAGQLQQLAGHSSEVIAELMPMALADMQAVVMRLRKADFESKGLAVQQFAWQLQESHEVLLTVVGPLSTKPVSQQSGLTFDEVFANANAVSGTIVPHSPKIDIWQSIGECLKSGDEAGNRAQHTELNAVFLRITSASDSLSIDELRTQLQLLRGSVTNFCTELSGTQRSDNAHSFNLGALMLVLGTSVVSEIHLLEGGDFKSMDDCKPDGHIFAVTALIAQTIAALVLVGCKVQAAMAQQIAEMEMQRFSLEAQLHEASLELTRVQESNAAQTRAQESHKTVLQRENQDLTMKLFIIQEEAATTQVAHEQLAARMRKEGANIQASDKQQMMALQLELEQMRRQANHISTRVGPKRGVVLAEAIHIIQNTMR